MLVLISPGDLLIIIKKSDGIRITEGRTDLSVMHGCVYSVCARLTSWLCIAEQQVHVRTQEGVGGGGRARGGRA